MTQPTCIVWEEQMLAERLARSAYSRGHWDSRHTNFRTLLADLEELKVFVASVYGHYRYTPEGVAIKQKIDEILKKNSSKWEDLQ